MASAVARAYMEVWGVPPVGPGEKPLVRGLERFRLPEAGDFL